MTDAEYIRNSRKLLNKVKKESRMTTEKQQTPLQKSITYFKEYCANDINVLTLEEVVEKLESLLPEEKQMVIDAFNQAIDDCALHLTTGDYGRQLELDEMRKELRKV